MDNVGLETLEHSETDKEKDRPERPEHSKLSGFKREHREQKNANKPARNGAGERQRKQKHPVPSQ